MRSTAALILLLCLGLTGCATRLPAPVEPRPGPAPAAPPDQRRSSSSTQRVQSIPQVDLTAAVPNCDPAELPCLDGECRTPIAAFAWSFDYALESIDGLVIYARRLEAGEEWLEVGRAPCFDQAVFDDQGVQVDTVRRCPGVRRSPNAPAYLSIALPRLLTATSTRYEVAVATYLGDRTSELVPMLDPWSGSGELCGPVLLDCSRRGPDGCAVW